MSTLTPTDAIRDAVPDPVDPTKAAAQGDATVVYPDKPVEHVSNQERLLTLAFVVFPFLGVIFAIYSLWGVGVGGIHVALLGIMYLITATGISVGYHRLFSHKAFKTSPSGRVAFAIIGAMAAEGTVRRFVANHRKHHGRSDREGDPHSPHLHDGGSWETVKGFVHAHTGWFLKKRDHPDEVKYAPEFIKNSGVSAIDRTNWVWVVLGLLIPTVIAGVWGGGWSTMSALQGLLWGGIVRIFIVHHVTWSVNSVCHVWGTRPFKSGDHSRNNVIFGYLGIGEGWHNNHHAFPYSARNGLRWWEFDSGWLVIRVLKMLHLVWDVRVPAKARQEAARQQAAK